MLNMLVAEKYPNDHDLVLACKWIIAAFDEMHLDYADDEGKHKSVRFVKGLLSGWRFTTWINSILNVVYQKIVEKSYFDQH
jgi:hypothetical protein